MQAPERGGLHQQQGGRQMEVREVHEVIQRHAGQRHGPDRAGVVHHMRHRVAARDGLRGVAGGVGVGQVGLHMLAAAVLGRAAGHRDHVVPRIQQARADGGADPGAAASHDGDRHASTSASTRNGLPEPCRILSGAASSSAPVAGNWSRLARHCSP